MSDNVIKYDDSNIRYYKGKYRVELKTSRSSMGTCRIMVIDSFIENDHCYNWGDNIIVPIRFCWRYCKKKKELKKDG